MVYIYAHTDFSILKQPVCFSVYKIWSWRQAMEVDTVYPHAVSECLQTPQSWLSWLYPIMRVPHVASTINRKSFRKDW
jgi:hypothetical protein